MIIFQSYIIMYLKSITHFTQFSHALSLQSACYMVNKVYNIAHGHWYIQYLQKFTVLQLTLNALHVIFHSPVEHFVPQFVTLKTNITKYTTDDNELKLT